MWFLKELWHTTESISNAKKVEKYVDNGKTKHLVLY